MDELRKTAEKKYVDALERLFKIAETYDDPVLDAHLALAVSGFVGIEVVTVTARGAVVKHIQRDLRVCQKSIRAFEDTLMSYEVTRVHQLRQLELQKLLGGSEATAVDIVF